MSRIYALPVSLVLVLGVGLGFKPEFFDPISFLLTFGGALTVTGFSYSKSQLLQLWRSLGDLFEGKRQEPQGHAHELRRLTELFRLHGIRGLENQEAHLKDPFLRFGVALLVDLNNQEKIRVQLEHKLESVIAVNEINRQILATLGKLLPSFGLIGTLIGMVLLLGSLATLDAEGLPSALGLSVLTTLYGAVAANVIVAPLLARLQSVAVEMEVNMNLTKEWILIIARGDATPMRDGAAWLDHAESDFSKLHQWGSIGLPARR